MLENNGSNLSGGQAQRIALARVFLKNPEIYIFDEATSALDNQTEKMVMHNINQLVKQGKTVIIISHELNNTIDADTIYVLKSGSIVENDNHVNLLKNESHYYHMWNIKNKN